MQFARGLNAGNNDSIHKLSISQKINGSISEPLIRAGFPPLREWFTLQLLREVSWDGAPSFGTEIRRFDRGSDFANMTSSVHGVCGFGFPRPCGPRV